MSNYPPGLSQERERQLGIEEDDTPRITLEHDVDDEYWESLTLFQKFQLSLKGHLTSRERYEK